MINFNLDRFISQNYKMLRSKSKLNSTGMHRESLQSLRKQYNKTKDSIFQINSSPRQRLYSWIVNNLNLTSVLNSNLLGSNLEPNWLVISHNDLLVVVHLELAVHRLRLQLLDLVIVQNTSLDIFKPPCYQKVSCWRHNWTLLPCTCKVVESSGLEVELCNRILRNVLWQQLKLLWIWLLLAHSMFKSCFAIFTFSWYN